MQNTAYQQQFQNWNATNFGPKELVNAAAMGAGAYAGLKSADGGEIVGPGGPRSDAIPARLSDGEYVIPEAVVRWKGLEFFDKQVKNSEKAMAERMAIPAPDGSAAAIRPALPDNRGA